MANKFIPGSFKSPHDSRDFIYSKVKEQPKQLEEKYLIKEWPVNNQGEHGSCVGQAGSAQKDYHEGLDTSPAFLYSLCKAKDGLNKPGTYPRTAMKVLKKMGICLESLYPYQNLKDDVNPILPSDKAIEQAERYNIKSYAKVETIDEIKQAIKEDAPVMAALLWVANMSYPELNKFVPMPYGPINGGHAVAITGWDDNLEHTYQTPYHGKIYYKGFFRVRNSWGEQWGDNGYCWMPYDLFTESCDMGSFLMEAWTVIDIEQQPEPGPEPEPEPEPDGIEKEFDVAPVIMEGRTMLEMRELAKITGAEYIDWKPDKQQVIIYYSDRIVYMKIGEKKYKIVSM